MLNDSDLFDQIYNKIVKKSDTEQIHGNVAKIVSAYIILNLQVDAVYKGKIPSAPSPIPDPLSGPVTFTILISAVGKDILMGSSRKGIQKWYQSLCKMIKLTTIIKPVAIKGITIAPMPIFKKISTSDLGVDNMTEPEDIWKKITKTLIKDIKSSSLASGAFPAVSSAGGIGTVSLIKCK